jgi:hypothetical protein
MSDIGIVRYFRAVSRINLLGLGFLHGEQQGLGNNFAFFADH